MDVVWLKKDVRLHDHAPLSAACASGRPFLIVYLYEPDQLGHKTLHGSHVLFANEGLVDLDARLRAMIGSSVGRAAAASTSAGAPPAASTTASTTASARLRATRFLIIL